MDELEGRVADLEQVVRSLQEVVVELSDMAGVLTGAAQHNIRVIVLDASRRSGSERDSNTL